MMQARRSPHLTQIKLNAGARASTGLVKKETSAGHAGDVRGLQLALAMHVVVLAAKLVAYYMTGVMALYAEALHTLSDIFISGLAVRRTSPLWLRDAVYLVHELR